MICTNCGKELDENAVFCPYCGKRIQPADTSAEDNSIQPAGEKGTEQNEKEGTEPASHDKKKSLNFIRLVLSFIIGTVLSFFTFFLVYESSFFSSIFSIALIIVSWGGVGILAYSLILSLSGSKGISVLGGIIIGAVGMWMITNFVGGYFEEVEMVETNLGIFISTLPVTLIWTFIVYFLSGKKDNQP